MGWSLLRNRKQAAGGAVLSWMVLLKMGVHIAMPAEGLGTEPTRDSNDGLPDMSRQAVLRILAGEELPTDAEEAPNLPNEHLVIQ
jgi:hypothetical protein